jgi:ATP-dependent Clp protease ATP-binding subunit ClpC
MFERFTDRARRVIVHAQDEARGLQHNYIGTEHLLLGLLHEPGGVASQALARFGMSLAAAREDVIARVGRGKEPMKGRVPFTPRAKKVLELALREALALQHNYIGTEHILLGLAREAEGAGPQIMAAYGADMASVREAVLDLLPAAQTSPGHRWLRRRAVARPWPGEVAEALEPEELPATPAAESSLSEAARLAGGQPVGSHHLLLATLADPNTAAARTLAVLGVDLEQARQALRNADVTGTSDEQPQERGRRQMLVRTAEGRLTLETADPALIGLAQAAARALGDRAGNAETIPGDLPESASLGQVWLALRDSLHDIRRRANAGKETGQEPASQPEAGAEPEAEPEDK